jgi:hypothetical protein
MDAGGEDRISTLPDEIIHHLLGFLPAPEAVRTSLLARGWRHHWKSMRQPPLHRVRRRPDGERRVAEHVHAPPAP